MCMEIERTESVTISMKPRSPIRTVLVDGSLECLRRLEKWIGTLPDLEIVGRAGSGVDALEQCRVFRPDLVIMDVSLPVMNGYEATACIKKGDHCPTVILMSLFHVGETYEDDGDLKADAVLKKDALYEELIPTVLKLFPRSEDIQGVRSFDNNEV